MSESAPVFNRAESAKSSNENTDTAVESPPTLAKKSRRKQQAQQSRQLLSCTKCRERKVKCDRTKPCSACCARGAPKKCHFVAEGGDYAPIQQSYELRKLRAENLRLKERLRASKIHIEDDDEPDLAVLPDSLLGDRPVGSSQKRRAARQRRFHGSEWSDSIYFGSPGLASVINDFASINLARVSTQSLAHLMPRGAHMYTPRNPPPHPFATLFKATPEECIPELLNCLPSRNELLAYFESFQKRVHVCSFPHVPTEITTSEVDRFLSDARKNAQMCPDMLALLFAALALGSQHSVWDKSGGQWKADVMNEELQRGNVYVAAAMQALRMASFMHKPTLLGIQALIMIGPYLTNSGRFLDAWTLFGTTIRLAQSIGLHRHPKFLDPAPPTQRECSIRQTLWWWMLHMDQEYSMTLGRPLGISGIGDCPPPHELTSDPRFLRFGQFVNMFTVLARQILSSDQLSNPRIDDFTDSLKGLLDTMPETLQFDETWLNDNKEIPEWPLGVMAAVYYCKTHNYLILLNRQRLDKQTPPSYYPAHPSTSAHSPPTTSTKAMIRGRALVLSSSEDLLTAFFFFYTRAPAALISWTIGQQAFNSCMILLLDAMETGDLSRIWKVEKAFVVFTQLKKHSVHELATLAVEEVSWGLRQLRRMQDQVNANVRRSQVAVERGGHLGNHINMQGAAGGDAIYGHDALHDTVMGNTGMLLLEDPGLQFFVPEAFAPFTWVTAGGELEGVPPVQLKREYEWRSQNEQNHYEETKPGGLNEGNRNTHNARSSEDLQVTQPFQGSTQGSAPLRYEMFHPAPSQEHCRPQGLTSPTSPTSSAILMLLQPHHGQGTTAGMPPNAPPHLRHHSYPSLHHNVPTPLVPHLLCSSANWADTSNPNARTAPLHCSSPSGAASSQAPVQTLSEITVHPQPLAHTGNPSVHPSWAARPAAPISSISEPSLTFSHVSDQLHRIPAFTQSPDHANSSLTHQDTFPLHLSSPRSEGTSSLATVADIDAEKLKVEQ